jgi:hypothetical protein
MVCEDVLTVAIAVAPLVVVRIGRRLIEHYVDAADDIARRASRQLRQLARQYLVHYDVLTPYVYTDLTDRGVRLTLRYPCKARGRRGSEHALTERLLDAFAEHEGIEPAPGVRATVRDGSGKRHEVGRTSRSEQASRPDPESPMS